MALAPFFSRAYSAVGAHLGITREELEKALTGHIVGIHLGEACTAEGNEKWIAELLVNLLARFYPALSISGDGSACENISKIAHAINPDIEIECLQEEAGVAVYVGETAPNNNGFSASASGWVAHIGKTIKFKTGGPLNPYSAGAAAALAAWRVFQTIFNLKTPSGLALPDVSLSLLDYGSDSGVSDSLPPVNLGEVAVAGLGAVGNPALWSWARHPGLTGELHLIDPEDVELSNLQRYCLTFYKDVGLGKAQLAERELLNSKLSHRLWPCSLEDFAGNYEGSAKLPTICVSVDNIEGRRTAQALLPRLVVNAWTSDTGLGASWHRFLGNSACLGCLYQPKGVSLSQTEMAAQALGIPHEQLTMLWVTEKPLEAEGIKNVETHLGLREGQLADWTGKRVQDVYSGVICGQVGLDLSAIGRVAAVPLAHQSVLAGILMAAELVKRSDSVLESRSQTEPLIIWDDIMRTPPKYWTVMRAKEPECFCNDVAYQMVFSEKWLS
jgi:hypothetical protein